MLKSFGMSAQLEGYLWQDVTDEFEQNGVTVKVHDGLMEVLYDTAADEAKAKGIADTYLDAHILRTGYKITANFNHTWRKTSTGATDHSLGFAAEVMLTERLQVQVTHQATIQGTARIVTQDMHDSASFTNEQPMAVKALADPTLRSALRYYSEQVVGDDMPMGGIYNAIEVITKHLGGDGRKKLATLAGQSKAYVADVMQTTQHARHPSTSAKVQLSVDECKYRAKVLIDAYAASLS
jgi:hypothetical protein